MFKKVFSRESRLLYLTMRHAATPVHSVPNRSSGCEKCWHGLKDKRTSALAGVLFAGTRIKRPRKPSASPIAFMSITPLPSFIMHLQLLTLKQPDFLAELGGGVRDEENTPKPTDRVRKRAWRLMVTVGTTAEDSDKLRVVGQLKRH